MGWDVPSMSHIPLIHGADGAKLSKRHGALGVEAYRAMGYLPEAMLNYLARLGWSHGDDEIMSIEDMIAWFDIGDVNKGAARFDFAKLEALNGVHMRRMNDSDLLDIFIATLPYLEGGPAMAARLDDRHKAQLLAALPGLKERAKTLLELVDGAAFLFVERPLPIDDKAAVLLGGDAREILGGAHAALKTVSGDWTAASAEAAIRKYALAGGHKLGQWPNRCGPRLPAKAPRRACSTCWPCLAARKAWRASRIKSIRQTGPKRLALKGGFRSATYALAQSGAEIQTCGRKRVHSPMPSTCRIADILPLPA